MNRVCLIVVLTIGCFGCGTSQPPPSPDNIKKKTGPGLKPTPDTEGAIVGDVTTLPKDPKRRKMVIWGKVTHIIKNKHGALPEVKVVSSGGVGDPVTEITNTTPYKLTLWFAGECAHHTVVEAKETATVVFCPGKYSIAAVVENQNYLPLVRENQEFKGGMSYVLQVVVKQIPH